MSEPNENVGSYCRRGADITKLKDGQAALSKSLDSVKGSISRMNKKMNGIDKTVNGNGTKGLVALGSDNNKLLTHAIEKIDRMMPVVKSLEEFKNEAELDKRVQMQVQMVRDRDLEIDQKNEEAKISNRSKRRAWIIAIITTALMFGTLLFGIIKFLVEKS